jgi:hypothetical protein
MGARPPQFSSVAKYYFAAESISKYNPIVSVVLRHVFADSCTTILTTITSPSAQQFSETYHRTLSSFPLDGPDETRFFANELFKSLVTYLQSGKLSPQTPDQFWLCATVYSILEGDQALAREQLCRVTAVRLHRLLATGKRPPRAKMRTAPKRGADPPGPADPLMRSCLAPRAPALPVAVALSPSDYAEKLGKLGVRIARSIPKAPPNATEAIQEGLDAGVALLQAGDRAGALARLRGALEIWTARPA